MRIMFAGTPAPALPSFEALLASTHQIAAVLTRPPAPVGRRRVMTPSPVHAYAEEHNIPVLTAGPNDPEVLEVLATVDCVAVRSEERRVGKEGRSWSTAVSRIKSNEA